MSREIYLFFLLFEQILLYLQSKTLNDKACYRNLQHVAHGKEDL